MALNDYKVIGDKLGQGGFGQTYLVQAIKLPGKPKKVLKRFFPNQDFTPEGLRVFQRLFKKEADMLGKLGHHPQIPTLQEYIVEAGEFCLVQEYIEGKSLLEELKGGVKLSEQKVLSLLEEILEVLKFIHEKDAIHLDLKPENMIRRKLDGKIVVIDFGGAKQTSALQVKPDGKTVQTVTVGTSGYMPSEQSNGKPKAASDVYAVGKIAIQALTGRHPHYIPEDVDTGETLWHGLASGVSSDFAKVIDKMIHPYFKNRYKDASEALKAIKELEAKRQPSPFTPNNFNFDPNSAFSPKLNPPVFGTPSPPNQPNLIPQSPKKNQVKIEQKNTGEIFFTSFEGWYISLIYAFCAFLQIGFNAPLLILGTWFISGVIALPCFLRFAESNRNGSNLALSGLIASYGISGIWMSRVFTPSSQFNLWLGNFIVIVIMSIATLGAVTNIKDKLREQIDDGDITALGIVMTLFIILGGIAGFLYKNFFVR